MARSFVDVASLVKTKGMKIGDEPRFVGGIPMCDQSVKMVKELLCLDSTTSNDCKADNDVKIRIAKAANAIGYLKRSIFQCLPLNYS